MDRAEFMETLRSVGEIVKTSMQPLSKEAILSYFKEYELDESQKEMIFNYLLTMPQEDSDEHRADEQQEDVSEETDYYSGDNGGKFQMYVEELEGLRKYDAGEIEDMCARLCNGDSSVINPLSEGLLYKVYDMAKSHMSDKYNIEDVVQEGNMALFIELTRICDEQDKCDVMAKVTDKIEEGMKSYISEVTGAEDEKNTILGKVSLVNEARQYLAQKNGTIPSDIELAQYTKIPLAELNDIMEILINR